MKIREQNYTVDGLPMSKKEFRNFVKNGEKGPFISSSEFKKKFNNWRTNLK